MSPDAVLRSDVLIGVSIFSTGPRPSPAPRRTHHQNPKSATPTNDNDGALALPQGADAEKAEQLMHKAEAGCLISNSLNATSTLDVQITQR